MIIAKKKEFVKEMYNNNKNLGFSGAQ